MPGFKGRLQQQRPTSHRRGYNSCVTLFWSESILVFRPEGHGTSSVLVLPTVLLIWSHIIFQHKQLQFIPTTLSGCLTSFFLSVYLLLSYLLSHMHACTFYMNAPPYLLYAPASAFHGLSHNSNELQWNGAGTEIHQCKLLPKQIWTLSPALPFSVHVILTHSDHLWLHWQH